MCDVCVCVCVCRKFISSEMKIGLQYSFSFLLKEEIKLLYILCICVISWEWRKGKKVMVQVLRYLLTLPSTPKGGWRNGRKPIEKLNGDQIRKWNPREIDRDPVIGLCSRNYPSQFLQIYLIRTYGIHFRRKRTEGIGWRNC